MGGYGAVKYVGCVISLVVIIAWDDSREWNTGDIGFCRQGCSDLRD